jgi:isoquinoline 1-oxidoreductase beta subunit
MKRRALVLSALGTTGALVVGWSTFSLRRPAPWKPLLEQGEVVLNGWISIAPNGQVVLAMPRSEMGQGIHTALTMLVAEELDIAPGAVQLAQSGPDAIFGNAALFVASLPFHPRDTRAAEPPLSVRASEWVVSKVARQLGLRVTGGSTSVADAWEPVRLVAASARASLLAAASRVWSVPVTELRVADGVVCHPSGRAAHYGELAASAGAHPPVQFAAKARADWKLIGRPLHRLEVPAKVDGSARFGLDVRLPGMLFATARMCPMLGGSLAALDAAAALALPGVKQVVRLPSEAGSTTGFAVVASNTWNALQGAAAVKAQWSAPNGALPDTSEIHSALLATLDSGEGFAFFKQGDASQAEQAAANLLEATYHAPYLAHATLEPMNCTARLSEGRLEVWAPTQVPDMAIAVAARVSGLPKDHIGLQVTLLGGGFGRRLEVDFIAQAVQVAMACSGAAVQLSWSREEDTTHDFYRPMHVARLRAAVDENGTVGSIRIQSAGDAITPRWMERTLPALTAPLDLPDKSTAEGLFDLPYAFANQHMSHRATHSGVPVGYWRSVGHSHNAFFSESFIDEMAAHLGRDPLEFRRTLLMDSPRHMAVLNLAAKKADWGAPLPQGHALGLALHESFGTIVAQVAEVSIEDTQPHVHRVVCAVDCGTVINPDIVAQQMEGAVVFGLTAALFGQIDIRQGAVVQRNFNDYPMLSMAQAPRVQTWIVESTRKPGGVGEPGVPPIAPAVSNALFLLTGQRQRSLPLRA